MAALLAAAALPFSANAQTCDANVPHITGTWEVLPYQMPINPISINLLPTGKVLIVAGSENDAKNNSKGAESYRAAVWDPSGTTISSIKVQNLTYDVFCSGTAALPDGRSLVVGGTSDYTFKGEARASFFDWKTEQFVQSQNMVEGRWYASAIELGDGSIMAMSGLTLGGGVSTKVEIYDLRNAGAGWKPPTNLLFQPPLYPRIILLPSGKVFYTGHGSGNSNANSWFFDPVTGGWTSSIATTGNRTYGSSVLLPLLPPNLAPRVMNLGGGSPATKSTEIVDLSGSSPVSVNGPEMSTGRIQMNAVLLPDGKVLAAGGSVNNEAPDTPGKTADLYNPKTNTFSSAGTAAYSRLYHSPALLLPDATVAMMGSNPGARGSYEPAIEIYTPPYLFDTNDRLITTNRPSVTAMTPSSGELGYNRTFSVSYTPSTSQISSVVLMRPGSATHAFDMEQRLIGLCSTPQIPCGGNGSLTLTTPENGNLAPPGYYMLFLIDSAGVPSKAHFVQLTPYQTAPPVGTIASPTADTTISAGGLVNFSTSTGASKYSWVFPGGVPATSTLQNPGNVRFDIPGRYEASLTVIDSFGNSDPHPPSRTVTVLPATPDFSIAVGPPAYEVTPGGTASFTVTITPIRGFTGVVTLAVGSESGFTAGVSSLGFSPATISGSGSSTLTMTTSSSAKPWALSLTVTGTSGALQHTASTTLLVNLASPASLSATPGDTRVSLSWPASAGASSYLVKRAGISGGPYRTLACPATTNYTDTGLINGTPYYYVVSAAFQGNPNAGGASANSTETSATPRSALPAQPTGLTATPGSGQVTLMWSAVAGATSYNVKRSTVSGSSYTVIANQTGQAYTNTGLANGTTYYYVVSAVNAAGEGANSAQVAATPTAAPPAAPTGLSAKSNKPGTMDLQWVQSSSAGVTQNSIVRRTSTGSYGGPIATINATTTYRDPNLTRGATYCYKVDAVRATIHSPYSNEACFKVK
jgi:fibronectin type 3 domain-containing protein